MSLHVLVTDILTLYREGHAVVVPRVDSQLVPEVAITVMSVEEQLSGWYSLVRQAKRPEDLAHAYLRLASSTRFLGRWNIFSYTEAAIARFKQLQGMKLNVGGNDLRIAAITLVHSGILVSRNLRGFQRVPGLSVEDSSV
jgi:tRNA(fMet)-specific endonuclease VapC